LLAVYESKGYAFASADITEISVSSVNKLKIKIDINENSKIVIDGIKIKGNDVTNDDVILRAVKLNRKKPLSTVDINEMKLRLERMNLFEKVEEPKIFTRKLPNGKLSSGLLIEIKEGNTNTFDGIVGYVPPVTENDKGYFTGLANVSFRNLFGTGRRISGRWQQENKGTQELEFAYSEPYFLKLPVNIDLGFRQRIQDSTYITRKLDARAELILSEKFSLYGILQMDRIIPSTGENSNTFFLIADSQVLSTGSELKFDSRDNIYNPFRGILFRTSYLYGQKKIYNADALSSYGYKRNYSIQRYSAELEIYRSFFKRQSVMLKVFGGEVKSDKLEEGDFFRAGGIKTIRGYREDQFLASKLAYGNFELRYSVSPRSFLFGFYDFGYYFKPEDIINNFSEQKGYLYGYGIGIRVDTSLGLLGVSYALGKGDSPLEGKIHFGIINDF
jgi:outer membrane protein insertion porin family